MTPLLPASIAALLAALPLAAQEAPADPAPAAADDAVAEMAPALDEAPAEPTEGTGTEVAAGEPQEVAPGIFEMTLGNPEAPVRMIEYGSLTCPHCAAWHANGYPQLKEQFIDTGKVHYTFREVYFDRYGLWASMVARCAGPMRFFPVLDQLFAQQRQWVGDGSPAAIADNLRRIGLASGLTAEALDACLSDAEKAEALVAWWQENAEADGINSTPTFIINGERHSNMGWEAMRQLLDAEYVAAAAE